MLYSAAQSYATLLWGILFFYALWKAFVALIWLVPYKSMSLPHTLHGCCGSKRPWEHQGSWSPISMWWPSVSQVVAQAAVRITSCFGVTLENALDWRTFPLLPGSSCAIPWCPGLSHSGQAQSSVGFSCLISHCIHPFGVTDKLILHGFSRRWFSGRDLEQTLSYRGCFLFSKTSSVSR